MGAELKTTDERVFGALMEQEGGDEEIASGVRRVVTNTMSPEDEGLFDLLMSGGYDDKLRGEMERLAEESLGEVVVTPVAPKVALKN